jgi:hypothetical protein
MPVGGRGVTESIPEASAGGSVKIHLFQKYRFFLPNYTILKAEKLGLLSFYFDFTKKSDTANCFFSTRRPISPLFPLEIIAI